MHLLLLACSLPLGSFAALQRRATAPTVTLSGGVVIGTSNTTQGQDRFLGIPFALPPTGDRRLRAPQPLTSNFRTLTATAAPNGCPQFAGFTATIAPVVASAASTALGSISALDVFEAKPTNVPNPEDCLYLNVQRPSGTTPKSGLPVVAWIYGGGFEAGSTALYDINLMLSKAMAIDRPFIFVAMNYRLAAFGFLASKELSAEGNTNLGLRDQRAALQWIQDNIQAFGGDPRQVTIWGESAGSWSVMDHTIINHGDNTYKGKALFRAAIMESGATLPALEVSHPKPQAVFDNLARDAGCDPKSSNVLSCLRKVDYEVFLGAQNNQTLKNPLISFSYMARPDPSSSFFPTSPERAVAAGHFARVPVICGNQEDEGALFGATISDVNGNDDNDLLGIFNPMYPEASNSSLLALAGTYPKNVTAGCPFDTGDLNEIFPGYKRLSAIVGDILFVLTRRLYLDAISSSTKAWSYIATYDHGIPIVGTCHATDILALYFGLANPIAIDEIFVRYISFIYYADPDRLLQQTPSRTPWPQYHTSNRSMLNFERGGASLLADTFRESSYLSLKANDSHFRM